MYQWWLYKGDERLSPSDLLTLIIICSNKEYCSKSFKTLAQEARLNIKTLIRSITNLETLGLISIKRTPRKPHMIIPAIPKLGYSQNDPIPKNGYSYTQKRVQSYTQKRVSNNNIIITEQGMIDLKIERGSSDDGYAKFKEQNGVSTVLDLIGKKIK